MNPPRLRRPNESLGDYRVEMGWDHAPARQCVKCEGFCLEPATVDQAMTAIATATGKRAHLAAYEALLQAARAEVVRLRAEVANLNTPQQAPQQVLKAKAATPDATGRGALASSSPDGGPMGAGQPAAAGPVEEGGAA